MSKVNLCYLCGLTIYGKATADHVPSKCVFTREFRRHTKTQFLKLPVHSECNEKFKLDEDYFATTLPPVLAENNASAMAKLLELIRAHHEGKNSSLIKRMMSEWDPEPAEMILAPGKIAKRFDGKRVRRVVWKYVRGLHFHEFGIVLPEHCGHRIYHFNEEMELPDFWNELQDVPVKHVHPGFFGYHYKSFPELDDMKLWALYIWDSVLFLVGHHRAGCECMGCSRKRDTHN